MGTQKRYKELMFRAELDLLPKVDSWTNELIHENDMLHRLLTAVVAELTAEQLEACAAKLRGCFSDRRALRDLTGLRLFD